MRNYVARLAVMVSLLMVSSLAYSQEFTEPGCMNDSEQLFLSNLQYDAALITFAGKLDLKVDTVEADEITEYTEKRLILQELDKSEGVDPVPVTERGDTSPEFVLLSALSAAADMSTSDGVSGGKASWPDGVGKAGNTTVSVLPI